MAGPDSLVRRPRRRGLGRYLLDGERIVIAAHQHWAKVALPVMSVVAGLVLALGLDSSVPPSLGAFANLLWWAWFALVGWAIWKVVQWRHDWFVATDVRLLLTYGLITRQVAMMPLVKVTDMTYNRSPLGRLLGYGTFVMESAGQDQALHTIRWVAQPDHTYRAICAEMFGVDDHERVREEDDNGSGGGSPAQTSGRYAAFVAEPDAQRTTDPPTGITTRPAQAHPDDPDSGHPEPNRPDPDFREADTGPIPHWRPST